MDTFAILTWFDSCLQLLGWSCLLLLIFVDKFSCSGCMRSRQYRQTLFSFFFFFFIFAIASVVLRRLSNWPTNSRLKYPYFLLTFVLSIKKAKSESCIDRFIALLLLSDERNEISVDSICNCLWPSLIRNNERCLVTLWALLIFIGHSQLKFPVIHISLQHYE